MLLLYKRIVFTDNIISMGTQATEITNGIQISVKTEFQNEHSSAENNQFWFSYHIKIENKSDFTFQLLTRHWDIFDSSSEYRTVDGEGVVGETPIISPGGIFEYESACNLTTDIGTMKGSYLVEREVDNLRFEIRIPKFELIAPYRLN